MPRRYRSLSRDVRGRWLARGTRSTRARAVLPTPPTPVIAGGVTGARGRITGRFLGPATSRLQTGGRIVGYQGAGGRFVNAGAAWTQTIQYLGGQSYDVGALSRLRGGDALSPVQRGVVSVSMNMQRFNASISRFLQEFGGNVHSIVLAHGLDFLARVVARTPRRTGRAANSWHLIPPNTRIDRYAYRDNTGRSFDGSVDGAPTGPFEVVIATNVAYMPALEAGHSKQAPSGMLAVTAREKTKELDTEIARNQGDRWSGVY